MLPPVGSGRLLVHLASLTKLAPLGLSSLGSFSVRCYQRLGRFFSLMVVEGLG